MTFEILNKVDMLIRSVGVIGENHGNDIKPAINLSIECSVTNTWLDNLAKGLLKALYVKAKPGEQGQLDGVEPVSELPTVRFQAIKQFNWHEEYTGRTLVLDNGISDGAAIIMNDAKVKAISLELKEGSVVVRFQVYRSALDEKERGRITSLIQSKHQGRVLSPEPSGQADVEDNVVPIKSAEQVFAEQHGR